MKLTEKHVQFTPDSYWDYNLPANTRLFFPFLALRAE